MRAADTIIPDPQTDVRGGDHYLVQGKRSSLLKVKAKSGIDIVTDVLPTGAGSARSDVKVVEMIVTPQSELRDRTLIESSFRERYGLSVIAVHRHDQAYTEKLSQVRLQVGDVLLVQGRAQRLSALRRHPDLWTLEELPAVVGFRKALVTAGFFGAAILLSALGALHIAMAFLGAALVCVLSRTISIDEAYEFIDWRLLVLVGGMMAFGTAMDTSGAARFLGEGIVRLAAPAGLMVVLAALLLLTILLTQPMSNAAAALVVAPVAVETAEQLGADPRTFVIAVMLGASVSLLTPLEPSCILVYGPGKYRFTDFVRVGGPLTALLALLVLMMLPLLWPLRATP
jgi:di/tricarboxylate transporter